MTSEAEARRRRAVEDLEVVGSPAEDRFERIVRLAASRFSVPVCLIGLVESDRQWFKARIGFDQEEARLSDTFCIHAIAHDGVMVVPDATRDARFVDNPFVTGPSHVRFYAGAPLKLSSGDRVGTFCILDQAPRADFSAEDQRDLVEFATLAADQMEQRVASLHHKTTETRYRDIVDSAASGIVVVDGDGSIMSANPATVAIFDRNVDGLEGAPIWLLLPDLPHPVASDGDPGQSSFEILGVRRDGSEVPVAVLVNRWCDSRGRAFATLIVRDLTARREAERALAASRLEADAARAAADRAHLRLEDAVEVMSGGFGLFDANDRLVVCNARARSLYAPVAHLLITGMRYEDILQASVEAGLFAIPDDMTAEDWIRNRLDYHRLPVGHEDIQLSDGRWVRLEDRRTRDGGCVCMRTDVTASKRREASFKLLFEANPVPMWLQDPHSGRIVEANFNATSLYGYDRGTFLAMSLSEIEIDPVVDRTSASGLARRHRRADGSVIDVEIVQSQMVFDDRDLILCGLLDVTARNEAEASLRHARDSAEEASRMKSQFLANMSHELRTPLNAILGFSQLMVEGIAGPLTQTARDYIGYIDSSGQHLLSIIEDVLDLSRFEAGYLKLDEDQVDLADTIASAIDLVRGSAVERGIVIDLDISAETCCVRGDPIRLKQIVANLISNAVKFSHRDTSISIGVAAPPCGGLDITVVDHGIGMGTGDLAVALEPFMQVEGGLDRRFEGCGVGLPLTKSLVHLHDGTLSIDSVPNEGTTVRVMFPPGRVVARQHSPQIGASS